MLGRLDLPGGEVFFHPVALPGIGCLFVIHHVDLDLFAQLETAGRHDVFHFLDGRFLGLAPGQAAVKMDMHKVGHSAHGGAARFEDRDGHGTLAEELIILEALVELLDLESHFGGHVDSVFPALGSGTVAGDPAEVDRDLHAAAVSAVDVEVGRLGADHEVRLDLLFFDDPVPAETIAILFHDGTDNVEGQVTVKAEFLENAASGHSGGRATLLVNRSTTMHETVLDLPRKGIKGPVVAVADTDCIHVPVDRQNFFSVSDPADHVPESIDADFVKAGLFHLALELGLDFLFLHALGRNLDKLGKVLCRVITVLFRKLHNLLCNIVHSSSLLL